jgi:hypothetical protein
VEPLENPGRFENSVRDEYGRPALDRSVFSIVNAVMSEALSGFPPNGMFVTILSVGQLKRHRLPIVTKPYEKVLFMGKEPPSARFAGYLLDVADLEKHLKDTHRLS